MIIKFKVEIRFINKYINLNLKEITKKGMNKQHITELFDQCMNNKQRCSYKEADQLVQKVPALLNFTEYLNRNTRVFNQEIAENWFVSTSRQFSIIDIEMTSINYFLYKKYRFNQEETERILEKFDQQHKNNREFHRSFQNIILNSTMNDSSILKSACKNLIEKGGISMLETIKQNKQIEFTHDQYNECFKLNKNELTIEDHFKLAKLFENK